MYHFLVQFLHYYYCSIISTIYCTSLKLYRVPLLSIRLAYCPDKFENLLDINNHNHNSLHASRYFFLGCNIAPQIHCHYPRINTLGSRQPAFWIIVLWVFNILSKGWLSTTGFSCTVWCLAYICSYCSFPTKASIALNSFYRTVLVRSEECLTMQVESSTPFKDFSTSAR